MTIEIHLAPQFEKVAASSSYTLKQGQKPLYHQMRTVNALKQSPLVMNTYNTGTGKTLASLFYLFELAQSESFALHTSNVLFIAPTNELLHQHVEDIRAFVADHELPFRVLEVNAKRLRDLAQKDISNRQGERLTRLIGDPRTFFQELGLAPDESRKPSILVTNPDLFYYALFWRFAAPDQRNLFQDFVRRFRYVVIDEFHYYNSKQLANFLFFIILSKEWGYFDRGGRKICLLSATPNNSIVTYLDRVLGEGGWQLVSPHNEPEEAENLPTTPVLAPTLLRVEASAGIQEYAETNGALLKQWIDLGQHGALISSALWRINVAHAKLGGIFEDKQMGRITGPQKVELRREDQLKELILATPTVDIGFNFLKHNKKRQNLDFVVFDARFRDEFTQRLGRVGRVLGKPITDCPSTAVALVNESIIRELTAQDGQTMTRAELDILLKQLDSLPEKDDFAAYLKAGGLYENAYPIYRFHEMVASDTFDQLAELFNQVRDVFAPNSHVDFWQIKKHFQQEAAIDAWLKGDDFGRKNLPKIFTKYTQWLTGHGYELTQQELRQLLDDRQWKASFQAYCLMRQSLMQAQFTFRDSFSGPTAWVYDPDHLLSDAEVTQYDLIHLMENYVVDILDGTSITRFFDESPPKEAICIRLRRQRASQDRQYINLRWTPPVELNPKGWAEDEFYRCFVAGKPIAIKGLILTGREPLDSEMSNCCTEMYIPVLLVPFDLEGVLRRATWERQIYFRDMTVRTKGGEVKFKVLLGTAALLMEPLLEWAFTKLSKERETAIFC